MDEARKKARKGSAHLSIIIAGTQTKGRGRLKRYWESDLGGLYFTMILRPEIHPSLSFRINFAAAVTFAQILNHDYGIKASVKWPNDILVDGAKLAGLLAEISAESDLVTWLNLGVGLNVNNDVRNVSPRACSMKQLLGRKIEQKEVLNKFLTKFKDRIDGSGLDSIVSEWKEYGCTLGRQVKIVTLTEEIIGQAIDIDETGALLIKKNDGSITRAIYGDCFLTDEK